MDTVDRTAATDQQPLEILYKNHRGEVNARHVQPRAIWWGSTEWHPSAGWLLTAFDIAKADVRDFSMNDILAIGPSELPADESYIVAKNCGDKTFLNWIANRLVTVHGDNVNADFVHTLRTMAEHFDSYRVTADHPAARNLTERESFMIEAAMQHGFEPLNDDATVYCATQEQIVSLMQNYQSPDQVTLSDLKINDWIDDEVAKKITDDNLVTAADAGEIARGAALQVVMDKATFLDNLVASVHSMNVRAGWWNDLKTGDDLHGRRNIGELLALIQSEISEANEAADNSIEHLMNIQVLLITAVAKGMNTKSALLDIHDAVSRALEAFRKQKADDKLPKRPGFRVELVDALIRILDTLGSDYQAQRDHPAGAIYMEKIAFNASRADHKPENRRLVGGKSI